MISFLTFADTPLADLHQKLGSALRKLPPSREGLFVNPHALITQISKADIDKRLVYVPDSTSRDAVVGSLHALAASKAVIINSEITVMSNIHYDPDAAGHK